MFAQIGQRPVNIVSVRGRQVGSGRNEVYAVGSVDLGPHSDPEQVRPTLAKCCKEMAGFGPVSADVGPMPTKLGTQSTNLTGLGADADWCRAEIVETRAQIDQGFAECIQFRDRPNLPGIDQIWMRCCIGHQSWGCLKATQQVPRADVAKRSDWIVNPVPRAGLNHPDRRARGRPSDAAVPWWRRWGGAPAGTVGALGARGPRWARPSTLTPPKSTPKRRRMNPEPHRPHVDFGTLPNSASAHRFALRAGAR